MTQGDPDTIDVALGRYRLLEQPITMKAATREHDGAGAILQPCEMALYFDARISAEAVNGLEINVGMEVDGFGNGFLFAAFDTTLDRAHAEKKRALWSIPLGSELRDVRAHARDYVAFRELLRRL